MLPNVILFQAMDVTGTDHLWETNGTGSGTFPLTPITGEPTYGFAPNPQQSLDLTVFNNQVLFSGRYTISNYGLWTTDGTPQGTVQLTGIVGANSAGIFTATVFPDFTVYNGKVLFNGYDTANKHGLWTTNGTKAGTGEITVNGADSTGVNPSNITVFNGKALFNGTDAGNNQGLWTTDGTTAGTSELNLPPSANARTTGGLDPTDMTAFGNEVLFNGVDNTGTGLSGLWVTDGTAAGTHEIPVAGADPSGLNPTDLTVFGNEVLFNGLDQDGHQQLWVTDGTAGGTHELTGINGANPLANPSGIAPSDLTVFNGKVLFNGIDTTNHHQLWVTDGTVAGTQELTPTTMSAFHQGVAPSDMAVYDGQVLFSGLDTNGVVTSLWTTDGTAAGTHEVTPIANTWLANGMHPTDLTAIPPPHFFNNNDSASIVWQNVNGQAAIWEMNGTNVVGSGTVGPNPGPAWNVVGTGDFNDDGHSDILWQNAGGQAAIWEMNGTNIIGSGTAGPNPGPSWQAIGTGDFYDNGLSDILWQNANGQAAIWEMNGTNLLGGGTAGPNPGPSWQAIGTGDFNGDGHSDILWQNTSGQAAIWEMNGTNLIGGGLAGPILGPVGK